MINLKMFVNNLFIMNNNYGTKNKEKLKMVEITPFKGITYNKEKIDNFDDVMSPPYDIISEKMQNELYDKNLNNFVKLILGKQ